MFLYDDNVCTFLIRYIKTKHVSYNANHCCKEINYSLLTFNYCYLFIYGRVYDCCYVSVYGFVIVSAAAVTSAERL